MVEFILASSSPRRLDLLAQIGIVPTKVIPADIDETPFPKELPAQIAERLAIEKTLKVAALYPDAIVLGADTVVACGRRMLDKTEDEAYARHCMKILSGRSHAVYGGICVAKNGEFVSRLVTTKAQFKRLTQEEIDAVIASGEWQGKAGGYAIQGLASAYIKSINGSYNNIVGLCLYNTRQMLQGFAHMDV